MSRFLFVSLPLSGHLNPIAAVAAELAAAGHEVAWAGAEPFLRTVIGPHATVYPIPLRPYRGQADLGLTATWSRWEGFIGPHTRHTLSGVDRAVRDFQPDALVVDQHAVAGALVAHRHGLRWATLAPTSMELTLPYRTALPKVEGWIRQRLDDLWTHAGLPGGAAPHDLRFSPYLTIAFNSAALTPGPPADAAPADRVALVGPALGPRPPDGEFPWDRLDAGRRALLITVGTLALDHAADFFARMVRAVAPLRDRVQTIVAAPQNALVDPPEHVVVVRRVPMLELLPRLDAVVSHGGLNTVTEALAHSVPLVIAPIKDDQPVNAAQVTAAGAGVRVGFFRSDEARLRAAVLAVLDEPGHRAAAARVQASFCKAGGARAAADRLSRLAGAEPSTAGEPDERRTVHMGLGGRR